MTVSAHDVLAAWRQRLGFVGGVRQHKLLYYTQAWHVTWFGEPLFPDTIEAWSLGPVVASLWKQQKYGDTLPEGNPNAIGDTGRTVLNFVTAQYGTLTGIELSQLTHSEQPWQLTRELAGVKPGESSDAPIPLELMARFYGTHDAADQAWYWTDDWQAGEHEASTGPRTGPTDADDFLASL